MMMETETVTETLDISSLSLLHVVGEECIIFYRHDILILF
jgi:hypothetical protein